LLKKQKDSRKRRRLTSKNHPDILLFRRADEAIPPEEFKTLATMKRKHLLCYELTRETISGRLKRRKRETKGSDAVKEQKRTCDETIQFGILRDESSRWRVRLEHSGTKFEELLVREEIDVVGSERRGSRGEE